MIPDMRCTWRYIFTYGADDEGYNAIFTYGADDSWHSVYVGLWADVQGAHALQERARVRCLHLLALDRIVGVYNLPPYTNVNINNHETRQTSA